MTKSKDYAAQSFVLTDILTRQLTPWSSNDKMTTYNDYAAQSIVLLDILKRKITP